MVTTVNSGGTNPLPMPGDLVRVKNCPGLINMFVKDNEIGLIGGFVGYFDETISVIFNVDVPFRNKSFVTAEGGKGWIYKFKAKNTVYVGKKKFTFYRTKNPGILRWLCKDRFSLQVNLFELDWNENFIQAIVEGVQKFDQESEEDNE